MIGIKVYLILFVLLFLIFVTNIGDFVVALLFAITITAIVAAIATPVYASFLQLGSLEQTIIIAFISVIIVALVVYSIKKRFRG